MMIESKMYMAETSSGKMVPIGEFKEVQLTAEPVHADDIVGTIMPTETISIDFRPYLDRKSREAWADIFELPKWMKTEWTNPRKKRRGYMRRLRRERAKNGRSD